MELYQLRTFLVVAEEKSITRAARRLFTTPPSISAHIKMLEDEWKVTLFHRTAKGMAITEKGEILRRKAEATLLAAQDLSNRATGLLECLMGTLKVGLNSSARFLRVPDIVRDLQENEPGVELKFVDRLSGEAMEELRTGSLDAGFIFGPPTHSSIAAHWLTSSELVVAGPQELESRMADGSWESMAELPWIASDTYCPFQSITERLFKERGLPYRPVIMADHDRTRLELIAAGVGLAIVGKREAQEAAVFIAPTCQIRCDLFFTHLRSRDDDPLIRMLAAAALRAWGIESRPSVAG